jgi:hypothetical protein
MNFLKERASVEDDGRKDVFSSITSTLTAGLLS